jgi:hypothetical protein
MTPITRTQPNQYDSLSHDAAATSTANASPAPVASASGREATMPSALADFVPAGGLHPAAAAKAQRQASDCDTWDKIFAFFRNDNGVGDVTEKLGQDSAELKK